MYEDGSGLPLEPQFIEILVDACWNSWTCTPKSGDKVLAPLRKRGSKSTKNAQPLIDRRTGKPPSVPHLQSPL